MGFNRYAAKMSAKLSMRQANPKPIWVTLVYLVLTVYLGQVLLLGVGNSFQEALYYIQSGYEIEEVMEYVFLDNAGKAAGYSLINALLSLFNMVMGYGWCAYALNVARNRQAGFKNLFDGFSRLGRVLGMNILIGIFSWLWSMACMVPGMILVFIAAFSESGLLLTLAWLLCVVGIIAAVIIIYRYSLSTFFLLDDPACKAREAINRSKKAMKGHVGEMFALDVSFIGWMLLGAITMGIVDLWAAPYIAVTKANFYLAVTGVDMSSGGYTSQMYGNQNPGQNGNGPDPWGKL